MRPCETSEGVRVTHASASSHLAHVLEYFLGSWFSEIVPLEMGDRSVKPESCVKSDPTRASSPRSISLGAFSGYCQIFIDMLFPSAADVIHLSADDLPHFLQAVD